MSTIEVQQYFEQVFRSHILQNQAAGGGLVNPFNGDVLIAHIESNYVTDNSDSITALERAEIRNDGLLATRNDRSMVRSL